VGKKSYLQRKTIIRRLGAPHRMACSSGSLLRDQPAAVFRFFLSEAKRRTGVLLTKYLLFARPLDRRKLLRKLFLQILRHSTFVWVVFVTRAIGDRRRLWPELRGKLQDE
jgi:hypothetical protein